MKSYYWILNRNKISNETLKKLKKDIYKDKGRKLRKKIKEPVCSMTELQSILKMDSDEDDLPFAFKFRKRLN